MPGAARPVLADTALAKVNLFLHVTGRRDDGYHLLESLFVFADVGDRLYGEEGEGLSLRIEGPYAGAIGDISNNLVLKAAEALRRSVPDGTTRGARLTLEKNLPVAAGLGGGSADAAAALRLLSRLWGIEIAPGALHKLALGLGADVPACLDCRAKLVTGIGDEIKPLVSLPPLYLVLANPGILVPTAAVFAERARRNSGYRAPGIPDLEGRSAEKLIELLAACGNDLEAAALALEPAIGDVIGALAAQPGCRISRMSGSGATCFGIFLHADDAAAASAQLAAAHPGWWLWHGTLAGAH